MIEPAPTPHVGSDPWMCLSRLGPLRVSEAPFASRIRIHQAWYRTEILGLDRFGQAPPPSRRHLGSVLHPDDADRGRNYSRGHREQGLQPERVARVGIHAGANEALFDPQGAKAPGSTGRRSASSLQTLRYVQRRRLGLSGGGPVGRRRPGAGWQAFGIGVRSTTQVRGSVGRWESLPFVSRS